MSLYRKVLEKMKKINCIQKERGAIFVLTAVLLPIMFGCLGIAYDVGTIYMHKARLQNVADAAALAGGRAYLQSQTKTTGTKDDIDGDTKGKAEKEYVIGGSQTLSGNHQDADKAADDYIYNNIINLGNKVYSDQYSHYALKGIKKSGDNYTEADEIFYRIGLSETVPLHFLPVITNKYSETVRAGAVAVVVLGTTTTTIIPGSENPPSVKSLFDDLFVVSNNLNASRGTISNPDYNALANGLSKIVTTFDGDMIFTGGTWDTSSNYTLQDNHEGLYLYTKEEKEYQLANGLSILQMNSIANVGNRLVQDTSISIDAYVSGFLKKLGRPHIELQVQNYEFNTSNLTNITNANARDFYAVDTTSGTIYYQSASDGNYYSCSKTYLKIGDNLYYEFQKEGSGFQDTNWQWINCSSYVFDTEGNQIFCYKNGNNWNFYKKNIIVHTYDWGTQFETKYEKLAVSATPVSDNANSTIFSYTDSGKNISIIMEKINVDFSQNYKVSEQDVKNSSVYHWTGGSGMNAKLNVNGGLDGDESEPIYIIVSEGNPKIEVTASNQRPVVYCYLGSSSEIELKIGANVTFKGTIYAPYKGVMIKNQSSAQFEGNVIANYVNIQEAGAGYTQKNFVKNDNDLTVASDAILAAQEARKQQATSYAQQQLASLGVTADTWSDASWFASQSAEKQQQLTEAWYNARKQLWEQYGIDMPDWPWSTGGKTTDANRHHYSTSTNTGGSTGSQTIITTTDETLRLINFRTEYQVNEDGSVPENKVLDPFIFETLAKPNSY